LLEAITGWRKKEHQTHSTMALAAKTRFVNQYPSGDDDHEIRRHKTKPLKPVKSRAGFQNHSTRDKELLTKQSENSIKELEYEILVMKEAADIRTQQIRDAENKIVNLERELAKAKREIAPIQIGETGIHRMLRFSQKKMEQQQEDCDIRSDQIVELRQELKSYEEHVRNLEDEKEIHHAKVTELLNLLHDGCASDAEWQLHRKSIEMAEIAKELQVLSKRLEVSQERQLKLEEEREVNSRMITELSRILSADVDADKVNKIICALKDGRELSVEQAQVLTIQNLKSQLETQEEEKQAMRVEIQNLENQAAATQAGVMNRASSMKNFLSKRGYTN